jgi:hypothetical protein
MNKRKVPITILNSLNEFLPLRGHLYDFEDRENTLFHMRDLSAGSEFFFSIIGILHENSLSRITVEYSPSSDNNVGKVVTEIKPEDLNRFFKKWIERIETYNNYMIDGDAIIDDFSESYFEEFELIDDPSNDKPLKPKVILLLDAYLNNIEDTIDNFITEDNQESISDLKSDVSNLRNLLTSENKVKIAKRLSRIWAKMTKTSIALMKEFVSEGQKKILTGSVNYLFEHGEGLIGDFIKHHK